MEERRAELQQLGNKIRDNIIETVKGDQEEKAQKDLMRRLIISLIFVVPLLAVRALSPDEFWSFPVEIGLTIPILIINHRVFIDGFTSVRHRRPEKNTLAAIGTIAAIAMGQMMTVGIFLTTMALCRYSEAYVNCKLDTHLKNLIEAEPEDQRLREGDTITVAKGEIIPADGVIVRGTSAVDEEIITGDRVPPTRKQGNPVFAGTRNLSSEIEVHVLRSGQDATISRIIDHITDSIATRAPISERAERAARIFVIIVLIAAVLAALLWITSGGGWVNAVTVVISMLLIASPYAFSVGVPMAVLAATVRGAKNGILIRSADILELARDINMIALNKTGTVTAGKPEISDVIQLADGFTLRQAGALELTARHPHGREIFRAALDEYGMLPKAESVSFVPGRGVRGIVEGKKLIGGNAAFMAENGISINLPEVEPLFRQGKSVVFFANENRVVGIIAMRDGPKPISLKAISRIEGMGIDVIMLTGDSEQTAEAIRSEVGIDRVYATLRPDEKALIIEALKEDEQKLVAMVGDGIEDAPAIMEADVGIAIGTGPDISSKPADVILIANDLMDVVRAISLSRKTVRIMRQNIAFAYCYNILAVIAAAIVLVPMAGTFMGPVIAALCMCASQILVIASTLRIKSTSI